MNFEHRTPQMMLDEARAALGKRGQRTPEENERLEELLYQCRNDAWEIMNDMETIADSANELIKKHY